MSLMTADDADRDRVEVAKAAGEQRLRLDEPFPVEICPTEIING